MNFDLALGHSVVAEGIEETGADQAEFTSEISLPAILGNFSIIDASSTKSIFSLVSDFNK